jgi:deoxyribonucleoside regulator
VDQRLVAVSRLFYERQMSKTDIAKEMGISITHVGRLLREATKQGIVKITIKPPGFKGLEVELKERFRLRDAVVVHSSPEERTLNTELGKAAARYFEQTVTDRQSVGLGSGKTLFEMVNAIEHRPRAISLYPLAVCAEQDLTIKSIDANTLVKILWFKSSPDVATAKGVELFFPDEKISQLKRKVQEVLQTASVKELSNQILELDNYFFSCSSVREGSQLTKLQKAFGDTYSAAKNPPIGDIVFNSIGDDGNQVTTQIEEILFRVSLETLHSVSSDYRKSVVLVGGGKSKFRVIKAGLGAQLFNTLVTDNYTAEQLLRSVSQ